MSENPFNEARLALMKEMIENNEKHMRENAETLQKMRSLVKELETAIKAARVDKP